MRLDCATLKRVAIRIPCLWSEVFAACVVTREATDKECSVKYNEVTFKIPQESTDYAECSDFVVSRIESILKNTIEAGKNKIIINTNLRLGLRMSLV